MASSLPSIKIKIEDTSSAVEACLQQLQVYVDKPLGTSDHSWGTGGDNGRYGAVHKDKSDQYRLVHQQHPCHAYMRNYENPIAVFNQYGHRKGPLLDEADRMFFDFVTDDKGPWKAFPNKSISHVPDGWSGSVKDFTWQNGWVWSDLSIPSNLQHNFLVAARMTAEWPRTMNKWCEWVKAGIDPRIAFAFVMLFQPGFNTHGDNMYDDPVWRNMISNKYDWPLDVNTSGPEYIENFLSGKVECLNKSYKESVQYTPVNRIFGKNDLQIGSEGTYPSYLFYKYHTTIGWNEKKCQEYFDKHGSMKQYSSFQHKTHWFMSEDDVVEIMKQEQQRLV